MTKTALLVIALCLAATQVQAQAMTRSIDKSYEAQKEAEIATARLQLATQPGSTAMGELAEAETALRRLQSTKAADQRAKIATELDAAIVRLKIAANSGGR